MPLLGPDAPAGDGVDDCLPCPGCYRPVYDRAMVCSLAAGLLANVVGEPWPL